MYIFWCICKGKTNFIFNTIGWRNNLMEGKIGPKDDFIYLFEGDILKIHGRLRFGFFFPNSQ